MPITEEHLGTGRWTVNLKPDIPRGFLDDIDLRPGNSRGGHAYATLFVTPAHYAAADFSDATLFAFARWAGVYLDMGPNRRSITGSGLIWLLGEDDGGVMWVAADFTDTGKTTSTYLTDYVFDGAGAIDRGNGLTLGTSPSNAAFFAFRLQMGQTPRQNLATLAARGPGGPYEWRANPDRTVDVDLAANLFDSGAVILAQEGGREGAITGLAADLAVAEISVRNYVTKYDVDWDDGVNNGVATNTPPATWLAPDGGAIQWGAVQSWKPKQGLRPQAGSDRPVAGGVAAVAGATNLAVRQANERGTYKLAVTAEIDEYDPWRFLHVGDTVYAYDLAEGLVDTANEVYYRGSAVHPQAIRLVSWETPILEGYGVYLRLGGGTIIDLTEHVAFEDRGTTMQLGTKARFHPPNARPRRTNRPRARQAAQLNRRRSRS